MIKLRRLVFNAATLVPGVATIPFVKRHLERRVIGTGGTNSARYCYSVWLRHLVRAARSGLNSNPSRIAELGPGDSLGTGMAALLSGADKYLALDFVRHTDLKGNLPILDGLVTLFRNRSDIPGDDEFPGLFPRLADYTFPGDLLTHRRLERALGDANIGNIRNALTQSSSPNPVVDYVAPWLGSAKQGADGVDMIMSQAVLEHVDELDDVYGAMRAWLAPGGFMSHQVDFTSHGWSDTWNGHWGYSGLTWRLIRGRDSWLINREPYSTHKRKMEEHGFEIVCEDVLRKDSGVSRSQLANRFRDMTDSDLTTAGIFVQARLRPGPLAAPNVR